MKKMKLRQGVKDILVVLALYSILIVGVILVNKRIDETQHINEAKIVSEQ